MTEWGEPIEVNGVRPEWLQATDVCDLRTGMGGWCYPSSNISDGSDPEGWAWKHDDGSVCITHIRLPSSHPYYTVARYNAEHGANFTYWPGGESAPDDWDGGNVLRGDGKLLYARHIGNWGLFNAPSCHIIGYNAHLKVRSMAIPDESPLHATPEPDRFTNESPIRAFTDWQTTGNYALGKGFRPSLQHMVEYLDAMERKEGWALMQVLEAGGQVPSFLFRRVM